VHGQLVEKYMLEGMTKDEASQKAYNEIIAGEHKKEIKAKIQDLKDRQNRTGAYAVKNRRPRVEVAPVKKVNASKKWGANSQTWKFDVEHPGELAAGINSYSDIIKVTVESGNPGGEENEFAQFMLDALKEWYDGARVGLVGYGKP
jgi:hypothetical protein